MSATEMCLSVMNAFLYYLVFASRALWCLLTSSMEGEN